MKGLKPLLEAPILSCFRYHAQNIARNGGCELAALENVLRSPEPNVARELFSGRSLLWLLARGVQKFDPEGVRNALRRGHYRAISRAREPVRRRYTYRGFAVVHDIRNKSQWNAYVKDAHQPGVVHWIRHYLPPGGTGMDVGANAGVISLEMADRVGPEGCIHAFEPNPEAYRLLADAIADNGLQERLRLYPQALGREAASLTLSIPVVNNGAASVREPLPGEEAITIPVVAFEAWWADRDRTPIDFVKVDVEGFEPEVVAALHPMLERDRPPLVFELDPEAYDPVPLLESLTALGYRLFEITHRHPFYRALPSAPGKKADLLAIPPGAQAP
jgi:FkbM family methyltransferase